jgi:hypothetical protein
VLFARDYRSIVGQQFCQHSACDIVNALMIENHHTNVFDWVWWLIASFLKISGSVSFFSTSGKPHNQLL